jgi:hypothetical protein
MIKRMVESLGRWMMTRRGLGQEIVRLTAIRVRLTAIIEKQRNHMHDAAWIAKELAGTACLSFVHRDSNFCTRCGHNYTAHTMQQIVKQLEFEEKDY